MDNSKKQEKNIKYNNNSNNNNKQLYNGIWTVCFDDEKNNKIKIKKKKINKLMNNL